MTATGPTRFRLHLSTLVVLTLAAGALLGLQFHERTQRYELFKDQFSYAANGFPILVQEVMEYSTPGGYETHSFSGEIFAAVNFALVLIPLAYVLETLARRREADAAVRPLYRVHAVPVVLAILSALILIGVNLDYRVQGRTSAFSYNDRYELGWPHTEFRDQWLIANEKGEIRLLETGGPAEGVTVKGDLKSAVAALQKPSMSWSYWFLNVASGGIFVVNGLLMMEWLWRRYFIRTQRIVVRDGC